MDKKKKLKFIFYHQNEILPDSPLKKKLLVCISTNVTQYSHVEVINELETHYGFDYQSGYYENDMFAFNKHDDIEINVTSDEYIKFMAQILINKNKPYNLIGVILNFIPWLSDFYYYDSKGSSFFSSEFLLKILIESDIVKKKGYIPAKTSPEELYNILKIDCNGKLIKNE